MKKFLCRALIRNNSKEFFRVNLFLSLVTIVSVLSIALQTVASLSQYGAIFAFIEYTVVIIFTLEYIARIYVAEKKTKYIFSFFGIVDLIAILPSLIGVHNLTFLKSARIVRVLAFLRTLRLGKVARLNKYSNSNSTKSKEIQIISVRIYGIVLVAAIMTFGTLLYLFEGENPLFGNIPYGVLWATQTILGGSVETGEFSTPTKILVILIQFSGLLLFGLLVHLVGRFVEKHLLGSSSVRK